MPAIALGSLAIQISRLLLSALILLQLFSPELCCIAEENTRIKLVVNKGHSDDVPAIDISPDGTKLVSGSNDESVKLWDLASGRELKTLEGPVGQIHCVAFSPDGKWIAAGDDNTNISIWNVKSGKREKLIEENNDWVTGIAFSPDGKQIASSSDDGTVRVFSFPSCKRKFKLRGHVGNVKSVAFCQDGKLASSGADNTIRIWDLAKTQAPRVIPHESLWNGNIIFLPNTKLLAATNAKDWSADLLDTDTGKVVASLTKNCCLERLGLSRDGSILATSKDGVITTWNSGTMKKIRQFPRCAEQVKCIAFNNDGKILATGGNDGVIRVWNLNNGKMEKKLSGGTQPTSSMVLSADGKALVTACEDSNVRIWDLESRENMKVFSGHEEWVEAVSLSNDGNLLASGGWDRTILIWDAISGKEIYKLSNLPYAIHQLAISKDKKHLAVAAWSLADKSAPSVYVYNLESKKLESSHCPGYEAEDLAFSPDGKHLLTGHFGNFACLWEIDTGKKVLELKGFPDSVDEVEYNPDGTSFACCSQRTVNIYALNGSRLHQITDPDSGIGAIAFSRDGKFLATGHSDNSIKIWNPKASAQKPLKVLQGHTYYITSLAFGKDGSWLASSSGDGLIKFWNTKSGKEICTALPIGKDDWAVVDPSGRFDASNLDSLTDLFWRFEDTKTNFAQMLPVEVFMRQYYTPRLLARRLNHEEFGEIQSIGNLNRLLPEVRIVKAESNPQTPGNVDITISYKSTTGTVGGITKTSGVYDVRLLRDGQLVGYLPIDESFAEEDSKDLSDGSIGKEITQTITVALPHLKNHTFKFTAYAFNEDKVKSASDQIEFTPKGSPSTVDKKAYVIGIGVNEFEDPNWNLRYAANDARELVRELTRSITSTGLYSKVIPITVVSEKASLRIDTDIPATKAHIKSVFLALAGHGQDGADFEKLNSLGLNKATPDDILILSISSHGDTDKQSGEYFLFPQDIGNSHENKLSDRLKSRGINSAELTDWLRGVDAGDIAIIIDACHSGAAEGKDFRPGPMDSRGLGQLAYYKRMRILSASQSNAAAKERADLKHGLLSYALLKGLQEMKADVYPTEGKITLSKWLKYGEREVPKIDLRINDTYIAKKDAVLDEDIEITPQTPKLLDFAQKRPEILLLDATKPGRH